MVYKDVYYFITPEDNSHQRLYKVIKLAIPSRLSLTPTIVTNKKKELITKGKLYKMQASGFRITPSLWTVIITYIQLLFLIFSCFPTPSFINNIITLYT